MQEMNKNINAIETQNFLETSRTSFQPSDFPCFSRRGFVLQYQESNSHGTVEQLFRVHFLFLVDPREFLAAKNLRRCGHVSLKAARCVCQ